MAGIKISGLPAVPSALFTDFYPVVQAGVTSKETLLQVATLFGFDAVTNLLALSKGGTNANLTAANGAVPYSTASAFALLAPGTTGQLFRSGGAGAPTWTTTTYPATNAINTIMYASSANVLGVITPVNSALLISSAGGVPSWSNSAIPAFTMAGAISMGSHQINNLTDPTSPQDAATKNYVDLNSLSGTAAYAATTGALTVTQAGAGVGATLTNAGAQATFALDSVNPPLNSTVLIKDQASNTQNGLYTVTNVGSGATNWVLTRDTDYDTPVEINDTGVIAVQNGATLAGTGWYNSTTMVTVDTTPITFLRFGPALPLSLANGGTNASLTASNGAIPYSTASAFALLAPGTSGQLFQSGGAGAPTWTTTTYPATNAINTIMYASSANVLGVITPANSSVLVSDSGGVPSWSTTLPAFTTSSITFSPTTGGIIGTTTNDNAAAGKVGEIITSQVLNSGTPVGLSNSTPADITSITLTAGDWDIMGNWSIIGSGAVITEGAGWISATSATQPDFGLLSGASTALVNFLGFPTPFVRVSLSGNVTYYLSCFANFATGSVNASGGIFARRRR